MEIFDPTRLVPIVTPFGRSGRVKSTTGSLRFPIGPLRVCPGHMRQHVVSARGHAEMLTRSQTPMELMIALKDA